MREHSGNEEKKGGRANLRCVTFRSKGKTVLQIGMWALRKRQEWEWLIGSWRGELGVPMLSDKTG